MKASDIPSEKFTIPFADQAGVGYIRTVPTASQIGITNGAASLTDGFPPLNFLPVGSGGVPPFGQDMNGILYQISAWTKWQNAGALVAYDSGFASDIGGYPSGALVSGSTAGVVYLCILDDNTSNPNTGGSGWLQIMTSGFVPTIAPLELNYSTPTSIANNTLVQATISGTSGTAGFGTYTGTTLTFTRAGTYNVAVRMDLAVSYTGPTNIAAIVQMRKNGTPIVGGSSSDGNYGSTSSSFTQSASTVIVAAVNDTFTVFGQCGSSSGFNSASINGTSTTITPLN